MNIHHVLSFCFFSALCGGNTRLVSAKVNIFIGAEGGNGSITCSLSLYGSRKFFCKNKCKAEDILLKTDDVRAQSGRFSTEYTNRSSGGGTLTVTITHLTKSDAGRYRCGSGKTLVPESYTDFEVRVSDGPLLAGQSGFFRTETEGEELTWRCSNTVYGRQKFFCKNKCKKQEDILIETEGNQTQSGRYSIKYKEGSVYGLHMTIKQSTKSDTGWYRCGYGRASSPDSYRDRFVIVTYASVPSASTPTPTTTQSQSSSSGSFTPSVSPETTDQLTASVPSASTPTPTTTQSQSSSSGSFTPSVSPETTDQLTASVPSASTPTPTTTQSQSSSSGSFTPSVSPETTDQLTASVPSASTPTPTTTQSQSSSSGSFTPSVSPETTDQLTALCGGNTRLVSAKVYIFTGAEGGTGSLYCHFSSYGSRKFFCKNKCKAEDILLKTDDVRAQSGRFSTEYRDRSSGGGTLTVTITHLTKSDAGRYRYGLGKTLVPESYTDFELRVSDGPLLAGQSGFFRTETEGEELTWRCSNTVYGKQKFFCKNKCKKQEDILIETDGNQAQSGRYSIEYKEGSVYGLYVTITQVTKSDAGWYRCGYGRASSPDSYLDEFIIVTDASVPSASTPTPTTTQSQSSSSGSFTPSVSPETADQLTGYFLPLVVGVTCVFVLLAVFLLLLYKWKTRRNFAVNTGGNADYIHMEASVTYENLAPVSTREESIYQTLQPASTDQDQTYSTL
ncbi:uncharacterized protein LOC119489845 [Sebastes umbrosus]|uniref:uncharacterized protein LOC119489845 n=1 Tax=Sebastes umbrosus TaxID=72105 RepID=UPI0018A0FA17|nr:uncharacterized protein LOC119489845 [Sebastes umbrosus]